MPGFQPIMPPLLTIIVMVPALYVILTPKASPKAQKWAEWAIATLLGYWLRGR